MRKLLALAFLLSGLLFSISCNDDDPTDPDFDRPGVTAPAATSVQVEGTVSLTFSYSAEAGFASSSASATGGTATVTTNGTVGDESGEIVVSFTAGTAEGAGSVTLTVTDDVDETDDATVVITVSGSPVPSITGIPTSATVIAGETLGPVDATITMEDAPGTLTITKNGEAYGDPIDITTDGQVVEFSYQTSIEEANSTIEFVFTAEDADGDEATATHVLTIDAPEVETIIVDANISANTTWETGKIYELATRVTVLDGFELTIEEGVVVKGQPGTGASATALLVARGGKLFAQGTAEAPIIFTSTSDNIIPGQTISPNRASDESGLWGGVIVLGKAKISASNDAGDVSEVQIEGIPTSDPNGLYGGNDDTDNSGVIQYISIRHGGSNIGSGNEINGLTLGGIGSETVIENVEVVANQDDGIEFFGGAVNVTNAVIWNGNDDGIDTDQSWSGTLDNFVVIAPSTSGAHAFELDGPEGSFEAGHIIKNGSVIATLGDRAAEDLINVDDNSIVDLENLFFTGISAGQDINRVTAAGVTFTNIQLDVPAESLADYVTGDVPAGVTAVSTATVGADLSVFEWTWTSKAGAFAPLQ